MDGWERFTWDANDDDEIQEAIADPGSLIPHLLEYPQPDTFRPSEFPLEPVVFPGQDDLETTSSFPCSLPPGDDFLTSTDDSQAGQSSASAAKPKKAGKGKGKGREIAPVEPATSWTQQVEDGDIAESGPIDQTIPSEIRYPAFQGGELPMGIDRNALAGPSRIPWDCQILQDFQDARHELYDALRAAMIMNEAGYVGIVRDAVQSVLPILLPCPVRDCQLLIGVAQSEIQTHLETHHGDIHVEGTTPEPCGLMTREGGVCRRRVQPKLRAQHIADTFAHFGGTAINCPWCEKLLSRRDILKRHRLSGECPK